MAVNLGTGVTKTEAYPDRCCLKCKHYEIPIDTAIEKPSGFCICHSPSVFPIPRSVKGGIVIDTVTLFPEPNPSKCCGEWAPRL